MSVGIGVDHPTAPWIGGDCRSGRGGRTRLGVLARVLAGVWNDRTGQGVISRWREEDKSPYRAPEHIPASDEARTAEPGIKGDVHSWAAVVIDLLTGSPKAELDALQAVLADVPLSEFLIRCRSKRASVRPNNISEVLETWRPWAEKQRTE